MVVGWEGSAATLTSSLSDDGRDAVKFPRVKKSWLIVADGATDAQEKRPYRPQLTDAVRHVFTLIDTVSGRIRN